MQDLNSLLKQLKRLKGQLLAYKASDRPDLSRYRGDPVAYAYDVLGITLWEPIAEALLGLHAPPYQVLMNSGHNVGKTNGAAVAINYWYDVHPQCLVISTAPTDKSLKQVLWTEVRLQRQNARIRLPNDLLPAASHMQSAFDHVATGYTANNANAVHGRHRANTLIVGDESEGIPPIWWDGMRSMLRLGDGDAALMIGNPLTTTSRAYREERRVNIDGAPAWRMISLSCLEHPNIAAGLAGKSGAELPIPAAITVKTLDEMVADWCDPVGESEAEPTDFQWRGRWWRPGPLGEPRILGRRPSASASGVWSPATVELMFSGHGERPWQEDWLPVVGSDSAIGGDDYSSFHGRMGPVSRVHESYNGWKPLKSADKIREVAAYLAELYNRELPEPRPRLNFRQVQVNIDDDATGRAVEDILRSWEMFVVPINASSEPERPDLYPNRRSELWFGTRAKALIGGVDLSHIPERFREKIRQQAAAPKWKPDTAGRRVVEKKEDTKKLLGRSPDDMDGVNLCYASTIVHTGEQAPLNPSKAKTLADRQQAVIKAVRQRYRGRA